MPGSRAIFCGWTLAFRIGALACLVAAGCESPPPDAKANHPMPGDLPGATTLLDDDGLENLRSAMRQSVPAGFQPVAPAPLGTRRWSDLSGAVASALLANGAAVLHETVGNDAATFTFKTTDGRRGSVQVVRVPQPTLVSVKVQVDAVVPAPELERAIADAVGTNLEAASKRRSLEDF